MKTLTFFLSLLFLIPIVTAQPLPDCYHPLAEIYEMMFTMQEETDWPERVKIDTIGYSQVDQWPIYSVKISDDAYTDYDRPVVAIFGPLHAEEVTGIELVMQAMDTLLNNPRPEFRSIRQNTEVYFVPLQNPDGVTVVWGEGDDCLEQGPDQSFRKNKRDANGNGVFDYHVGWGDDIDGVDLNRNWDINFFHGDTLYQNYNLTEPFDYYRGEHPFSESETRVIRDFCREIRPLYSATFHDSRTGTYDRTVMWPWGWNVYPDTLTRRSPDFNIIDSIADEYISSMDTYPPFINYPSVGRNGKMHDWMYAEGGWINMQTELQDNQPGCDELAQYIDEVLPAIWYLMHRAYASQTFIGYGVRGHLKVTVTDENGDPMVAEVYLPEHHDGYLKPRMTDPVFGVHRRALMPDGYQVVVRAWGYEPNTSMVTVHETIISEHHVSLERLPREYINIHIQDPEENDIPATIVMHYDDWWIDTLDVDDGRSYLRWPNGHYKLDIWSVGFIPYRMEWDHLYVPGAEDFPCNPNLIPIVVEGDSATQVWKDEFETAQLPDRWSSEGDFPWVYTSLDCHNGSLSLKSANETYIPCGENGTLTLEIDVPENAETLTLMGWRAFELEPDRDFCHVELSIDGNDWTELEVLNGFNRWHRFFYDLREYNDPENTIWIRWNITTDDNFNDRGLFLDDVSLQASPYWFDGIAEQKEIPGRWALYPAFPNPFNPSAKVVYEIPALAHVDIRIYDILGREAISLLNEEKIAGTHTINVDMSDFASGIYFIRMQSSQFESIQKLLLVK